MFCERFDAELNEAAVGGAVAPGLAGHLEACPDCREEMDARRSLFLRADALLTLSIQAEPSPGFGARVRQAVANHRVVSWPPLRFWSLAAAVPLVVVVVALSWTYRPKAPPEPTPIPAASRAVSEPSTAAASPSPQFPVMTHRPTPPRAASFDSSDVQVPPGQTEAILRYAEIMRHQIIPEQSLTPGLQPTPAPLKLEALAISPIAFEPLDDGS